MGWCPNPSDKQYHEKVEMLAYQTFLMQFVGVVVEKQPIPSNQKLLQNHTAVQQVANLSKF